MADPALKSDEYAPEIERALDWVASGCVFVIAVLFLLAII